uniref:Amiloride-sensitive sodium channel n=1 Tax=Macrostomum lignano TaxID=282301 RepID=A0A1I8IA72_9PLAT
YDVVQLPVHTIRPDAAFPSVTICNQNPISLRGHRLLRQRGWPGPRDFFRLAWKRRTQMHPSNGGNLSKSDAGNLRNYISGLLSFNAYFANLPKGSDPHELGHSKEDLIRSCYLLVQSSTSGKEPPVNSPRCDHLGWWRQVYDQNRLNCYTYMADRQHENDAVVEMELRLFLGHELNFDCSDCVLMDVSSQTRGATVVLHPNGTYPDVQRDGFTVYPGTLTEVTFATLNWTRLGPPYGNCDPNPPSYLNIANTEGTDSSSAQNSNQNQQQQQQRQEHRNHQKLFAYTSRACHKLSLLSRIQSDCNCSFAFLLPHAPISSVQPTVCESLDADNTINFSSSGLLRAINRTRCGMLGAFANFDSGCREPCSHFSYQIATTQSQWPRESMLANIFKYELANDKDLDLNSNSSAELSSQEWQLAEMYEQVRQLIPNSTANASSLLKQLGLISDSFVTLKVTRKDFSVTQIAEKPVQTLASTFSQVGGLLSMWIGLTFVWLVELLDLGLQLLQLLCRRLSTDGHRKSSSTESKSVRQSRLSPGQLDSADNGTAPSTFPGRAGNLTKATTTTNSALTALAAANLSQQNLFSGHGAHNLEYAVDVNRLGLPDAPVHDAGANGSRLRYVTLGSTKLNETVTVCYWKKKTRPADASSAASVAVARPREPTGRPRQQRQFSKNCPSLVPIPVAAQEQRPALVASEPPAQTLRHLHRLNQAASTHMRRLSEPAPTFPSSTSSSTSSSSSPASSSHMSQRTMTLTTTASLTSVGPFEGGNWRSRSSGGSRRRGRRSASASGSWRVAAGRSRSRRSATSRRLRRRARGQHPDPVKRDPTAVVVVELDVHQLPTGLGLLFIVVNFFGFIIGFRIVVALMRTDGARVQGGQARRPIGADSAAGWQLRHLAWHSSSSLVKYWCRLLGDPFKDTRYTSGGCTSFSTPEYHRPPAKASMCTEDANGLKASPPSLPLLPAEAEAATTASLRCLDLLAWLCRPRLEDFSRLRLCCIRRHRASICATSCSQSLASGMSLDPALKSTRLTGLVSYLQPRLSTELTAMSAASRHCCWSSSNCSRSTCCSKPATAHRMSHWRWPLLADFASTTIADVDEVAASIDDEAEAAESPLNLSVSRSGSIQMMLHRLSLLPWKQASRPACLHVGAVHSQNAVTDPDAISFAEHDATARVLAITIFNLI